MAPPGSTCTALLPAHHRLQLCPPPVCLRPHLCASDPTCLPPTWQCAEGVSDRGRAAGTHEQLVCLRECNRAYAPRKQEQQAG